MNKKNRPIRETSATTEKKINFQFIFPFGKAASDRLKILDESIRRIKKEYLENSSFIFIDDRENNLKQYIEQNSAELTGLSSESVKISPLTEIDKQSFKQGKRISVWINPEHLISPINFNDIIRNEFSEIKKDEFFQINWVDNSACFSEGFILNSDYSDFLLTKDINNKADFESFAWYLRNDLLNSNQFNIYQTTPFEKPDFLAIAGSSLKPDFQRWISRNITGFFRKPSFNSSIINSRSTSAGRFMFFTLALFVLISLPFMSYFAGISGDEEKHYAQAEKVYNFYSSHGKDTTSLSDEKYKLNYYGQSFDLFSYVVIKKLNIKKVYETRHVLNGTIGALAILCSGLLARLLLGDVAGIITMLLLYFSPGFLGHSMNNPLDIPFAFGYIFTLFQLVRFLKRLPNINYGIAVLIALGIAFTISIRIGGLILIPYICFFSGLYLLFNKMPWKVFSQVWWKFAAKGLLVLGIISLFSFFLSLLPWPYGLQNPLKNPFEAMKIMENITVSLKVMFDGKIIWSDNLPATYIPKSMLFSIPLTVLIGFILMPFFTGKNKNLFWTFFLFFVVVFPVVYIIYKQSNVYGAWRHLLFIYPPMVVMAGMGLHSLLNIWKNKYFQLGVIAILLLSLINPVSHIIRNFPNQYIYFNEIAGGVKKAYKKYETDYYMVSLKPGTDWIKQNILNKPGIDSLHPVKIISNAPSDIINYYFRDYKEKVRLPYTRYYDRGIYDWDYAIFFCNYIDPYHITHDIWPPKNTIYNVTVDGVKICAIVKRENRDDYQGFEMLNRAIGNRSGYMLDKSVEYMENAIAYDKYNEITYLNLGQAYILMEKYDLARKKLNILLSFYPNYEKAINLIGYSYMSEGESTRNMALVDRSISIFNDALKINYKFASAYHNLGLAYLIKGDDTNAFNYFQKSIDNNSAAKESYYMIAGIIEKRGDPKKAREIREFASRLQ